MAGRPPLYETPEALQEGIDKYFKEGVTVKVIKDIETPIPTITGLCYFLGFESRQSFYAYEAKPAFSYTVKKARLFIEKHYEELLQAGNTIGAIFALKNFDWKDKQEIANTVTFEQPVTEVEIIHTNENQGG
jgi:hypothetical protein